MRKEKEMTEKGSFNPASNAEENYSRKEQFLDSGFRDWSMDLLENEIFGFVAPRPLTEREVNNLLKKLEQEAEKKQ